MALTKTSATCLSIPSLCLVVECSAKLLSIYSMPNLAHGGYTFATCHEIRTHARFVPEMCHMSVSTYSDIICCGYSPPCDCNNDRARYSLSFRS